MKMTIRSLAAILGLVAAAHSADYFPLAKGNSWNYAFSEIFPDSVHTSGVKMMVACDTVIGSAFIFGIKMWSETDTAPDRYAGYYMVRGNGIFILDSLGQPMTNNQIIEHHPTAGDGWRNDNGDTMTVVYFGSITVPAGTFDSCYATVDQNGDTVNVFAPNVGMVRIVHVNNSRFELTAYSVHLPNSIVRPVPNISHASKKPGLHPGRYSLLNAQGRFIDIITIAKNGAINRILARGTYFLIEKEPGVPGVKQAKKLCVTGKQVGNQ
jgi:hypothetical protein